MTYYRRAAFVLLDVVKMTLKRVPALLTALLISCVVEEFASAGLLRWELQRRLNRERREEVEIEFRKTAYAKTFGPCPPPLRARESPKNLGCGFI